MRNFQTVPLPNQVVTLQMTALFLSPSCLLDALDEPVLANHDNQNHQPHPKSNHYLTNEALEQYSHRHACIHLPQSNGRWCKLLQAKIANPMF